MRSSSSRPDCRPLTVLGSVLVAIGLYVPTFQENPTYNGPQLGILQAGETWGYGGGEFTILAVLALVVVVTILGNQPLLRGMMALIASVISSIYLFNLAQPVSWPAHEFALGFYCFAAGIALLVISGLFDVSGLMYRKLHATILAKIPLRLE